ncbi:hypothetical protein NDU88_004522 [Pleurodeles waltl]|uniref:Uncharacterized protein n=1 Tax=Pleurodeles waltl TaxID=8319 RepID=A0AAV7M6J6_PLEWA|nr:hypothetical protein NDU88_004522 [Pleurodeles waltl]
MPSQWYETRQRAHQHDNNNKKIDKYAKQKVPRNEAGAAGGASELEGAAQMVTLLQPIGDLKVTMEGKMGELKVDLAFMRQDL